MHPNKFSVKFYQYRQTDNSLLYKKKGKLALIFVQALAAAVLTYCLFNIGFWMEDSYSFQEMSKSYEETDLFFRQIDTILEHRICAQENDILFEKNGEFDGNLEIDIQSYGKGMSAVKDLNTTYLLSDLLTFCQDGSLDHLHAAVNDALVSQNRQRAGEELTGQAETLETIRPITGISLAECSLWYSDSAGFVLDMYSRLDEVCQDILTRFEQYSGEQDESWSRETPGNLLYCIENTTTGMLYTNTAADSYEEAKNVFAEQTDYTPLYEGERSFNIMVAEPDGVLNDAAEEWFLNERFVNTNEKVLLAVNLSYPVSDELQLYAEYFSRREDIVRFSVFLVVVSVLVLVAAFLLSMAGAGWQEGRLAPKLYRIDRIPTEVAGSIYLIFAVLVGISLQWQAPDPENIFSAQRLVWSLIAAGCWLVFLSGALGFMRRLRAHKLWHNSICRMLLHTWRRVTAARAASGQLLFAYIAVMVLNFLFLVGFHTSGIVPLLVVDVLVLLFLLRDMAGKQSVWEGIHQISKGDLSYKIDTTTLTGESYEMAKAVNEMGDGLKEALEAIVKNERLKAELITNVSHDLKTPLTSIVNYVDLLKREHLEGERVQHYIEVLDQKSQRLRQLTEDLVEVSKINSGNVELHMTELQVQSMLRQAYGEFEERLEEHRLSAVWNMPKQAVRIMADGRQFWRVLENLLGNICKYAREESNVFLTVTQENGMARIELSNTTRETLTISAEELMGRFVRGDRSRNTEGSGLGLSIAESLTELQGGTFRLEIDQDQFRAVLQFPEVFSETKLSSWV